MQLSLEIRDAKPDVVLHMIAMGKDDARAAVSTFAAGSDDWLLPAAVMFSVRIFTGIEPGSIEPMPLTEESSLRSVLYPHRGEAQSTSGLV